MPDQIDFATASQLFDTEVTIRYQNKMRFQDTVEERHGTTGDATNVPLSALIEMSQKSFAPSDLPATEVDESNNLVVPKDYFVKTYIGGGQKTLFAYDKITTQAKLHADAAGRLLDLVKLNAIYNDPNFSQIPIVLAGVGINTGMNSQKLANGLGFLEDAGVDTEDYMVSMLMPALVKQAMLNDPQVTNIFYNDVKPLTNNRIKAYLGVDVRTVGSVGANKLPRTGAGNTGSPFVYQVPIIHKESMVQIFNREVQTSITWVQQNDRYELLTVVTTGAKLIQPAGVALITAQYPFVPN